MKNFLLAVLLSVMTAGCGIFDGVVDRPEVDSMADAIAVSAADITSLATEVHALCGNLEPGGPCLDGALISTEAKEQMREQLQEAQDALVLANTALNVNDGVAAGDYLTQVETLLTFLRDELEKRQ